MDTESTYLDLYDALVDDAEYLQADAEDGRQFLLEAVIVGALSAMLLAFCNGFFGRFGEKAAEGAAQKVKGLFKRGAAEGERDATIEGLDLLKPYLHVLGRSTEEQVAEEIRWIADHLERRGFPAPAATQLAQSALAILRAAGTGP